jgi:hypothetical protein
VKRALENSFQELAGSIPATIGIAIAAADGSPIAALGTWSSGVAWSTIKVPLAIAAMRAGVHSGELVCEMITQSDNAAAEALWSLLGDPVHAAQQLQAVIRDGGDATTMVESRRLRVDYTAFGQTRWSLVRQAQFAARLPGISGATPVLDLMNDLSIDHRWGLAAKGFAAKGGWGPGLADDYLVRQFGIVPTPSDTVGVAIAAEVHDGEHEAGVDVVNRLAGWVVDEALSQQ